MNANPCLLLALAAAQILFIAACRKGSESTPAPASPVAAFDSASAPKQRHHNTFMGGVSPLIVSMSPETIPFHDGHLPVTRYSLTYEIDHPEKVTKAYISIYAPGIGEVQQFDVDVQSRAQIEFMLDASNFDLGPTVRFRVHCPYGDTDWFIMGSDPMNPLQIGTSREIGNVSPSYIAPHGYAPGAGMTILIASGLIMKTCTAEAQVESSNVELQNIVAGDKRLNAVLPLDALQGRPVTMRHLEVKLVVNGPGMPAADIYNLKFEEE